MIYDDLNLKVRRGERWCVMGKNGAGKSTLLKMVSGAVMPDAGSVQLGASLKMGTSRSRRSTSSTRISRSRSSCSTISRTNRSACCGIWPARSSSPVMTWTRSFARCQAARSAARDGAHALDPPNFLVLDEPTNHLDLATKQMLVEALSEYEGTMLFVSHDRAFLRGLSNRVLELGGESGVDTEPHVYPGSYVDYVARTGHEAPGVHH